MVANVCDEVTERVGQYEIRIRCGERTPESEERWRRRGEVWTNWLLDRWKRQQRQDAERN